MFGNNQKDNIRVIKASNGNISKDIKARVDSRNKIICIYKEHLPDGWFIEDGDTLERVLPGDQVERFNVVDSGYKPAGQISPEKYDCYVTKGSSANSASSITYNLHGSNSRVYSNSIDYSNNVVSLGADTAVFNLLNKVIEDKLSNNAILKDLVKGMEQSQKDTSFVSLETYQKFIAQAANHMTLFAPFIPALTEMLK